MTFTCATYNILHGYHRELILNNIRFLIQQGADAICLQEAEVRFEESLRALLADPALSHWEVRFAHAGLGGNVATLWNMDKLQLRDSEVVALPKLTIPSQLQKLRGLAENINRIALTTEFDFNGQTLQITNVHLAWEGGSKHRLGQLRHVREQILSKPADFRVLMGDFNTIAPKPLRLMHERRIERMLGAEFHNAFPRLPWTYDISFTDPSDGLQFMATLSRAGIRLRRRLDYVFAKDMTVISGVMHDLPGSDHRPLIATFGLQREAAAVQ